MQLSAFVLHLTRAEKRRANAHDLRDNSGLASEIWPAVDGSTLSSSDLSTLVRDQVFDPPYPFPLKTGEIGCFLSHRQMWAEIVRRGLPAAFIIEDDAGLDPDLFDTALDMASQYIDQLGYIQFQTRAPKDPKLLIDTTGGCTLTVPQQGGLRTTAQMVSIEAAQHLLDRSQVIDRPVDTFVQSHWFTGLRPAMIYPSGVLEIADTLDGSTIQGGKKPIWDKLKREISRTRYRSAVKRLSRHSEASAEGGLHG
ncbi:glycosyltransferase family 25 protein [uncultured Roseovarius sp.]|uniref:glycosyltransferase family 25 protein n=1 Tax=uncultured Roseovarius sp. TaxID=293344 RepID=UPI00261EACE8|nr:glycosyltransferase family 25 protein [uncultured Roseovarius sp.]